MDSPAAYNDDRIDAATLAYNDLTPDSITAFRALNEIETVIVIRILKEKHAPKVGRPRGTRNKTKATDIKAA